MLAASLVVLAAAVSSALAAPSKRDTCVAQQKGTLKVVDPRAGNEETLLGLSPVLEAVGKPFLQRAQAAEDVVTFTLEDCGRYKRFSADINGVHGCLSTDAIGLDEVYLEACGGPQLSQGWRVFGQNQVAFFGNEQGYHTEFQYLHGNQVVSVINQVPAVDYTIFFTPA